MKTQISLLSKSASDNSGHGQYSQFMVLSGRHFTAGLDTVLGLHLASQQGLTTLQASHWASRCCSTRPGRGFTLSLALRSRCAGCTTVAAWLHSSSTVAAGRPAGQRQQPATAPLQQGGANSRCHRWLGEPPTKPLTIPRIPVISP